MKTEYEATFPNINRDQVRERLKACNAFLRRPEFLQYRCVFDLPEGQEIAGSWIRLRDEGDRITLTLKLIVGQTIEEQKELEVQVDDFQSAEALLEALGCRKRAYQESKRELWELDGVAVTIDSWPFLSPFVEVEGVSEQVVREVCEKLGLPYQDAIFCSIDVLYARQYGISTDVIKRRIPALTFDGENPLLKFVTAE